MIQPRCSSTQPIVFRPAPRLRGGALISVSWASSPAEVDVSDLDAGEAHDVDQLAGDQAVGDRGRVDAVEREQAAGGAAAVAVAGEEARVRDRAQRGQLRRERVRRPPRRARARVVDVAPAGQPVEHARDVEQVPVAPGVAAVADRVGDRLVVEVDRVVDGARLGGRDVRVLVRVEVGVGDPRARVVREVARARGDLAADAAGDRRDRDVRHGRPDHMPRGHPFDLGAQHGQVGAEVRRAPHGRRARPAAPDHLEVGDCAERVVGAEEDDQGLDAAVGAQRPRRVEQGHRPRRGIEVRIDAQGRARARVLDELVGEVVLRRLDRGRQAVRGVGDRVAQVPAVHRQRVVDGAHVRRDAARAPLPVVLGGVHQVAHARQRARQLPPVDLGAEVLLEVAQDELEVDRQAVAGTVVDRVAEVAEPQRAGDQRRIRQPTC